MYLKAIEIQGFKSFADKTKITFDTGVTAIVGPNGSGKSNVTESLRWALGESSAKSLRGGKMADVIFAGTQNRSPLNSAIVRVSLDNSDGYMAGYDSDIQVERRVYRNGDSDYLINGKKVRLRDIHDLFMDTGLGRDSFSVISQGRVESIFNSKPEERRAIFEEAAGVLKYKTRKKETQNKLAHTQDNLDRLADIIYELDSQVGPLQKQAQVAQRFLDLDQKREKLALAVLVHDVETYKHEKTTKEVALEEARQALSAYYAHRESLENDNQSLKKKRQDLSANLQKEQDELRTLTGLIADLEGRIRLSRLQKEQAQAQSKEQAGRLQKAQEHQQDLLQAITIKERETQQAQKDWDRLQLQLQEGTERLAQYGEDPETILENLRDRFVDLMQEEARLTNKATGLERELTQVREKEAQENAQHQTYQANLEQKNRDLKSSLASYEQARDAVQALLLRYKEHEMHLAQLRKQYQDQQEKMFAGLDRLKTLKAKKSSLETILANHSHYYAGVKAVMQARLPGIIGPVSEHVSFDKAYMTALEVAMQASAQHIIVADEAAAKGAINHLKKTRGGRATFLPLTTIRPRELQSRFYEQLSAMPGFIGVASQLVTYADDLRPIFSNLLGSTVLFETVDQANAAAKRVAYQVRLITLDGTELRPGGSFSGGARQKQNATFLKPEIEQLQETIVKTQAEGVKAEKQTQALKQACDQAQADLLDLQNQGETARLAAQKAELIHQQIKSEVTDLETLLTAIRESADNGQNDRINQSLDETQQELALLRQRKVTLEDEIESLRNDKDDLNRRRQSLQAQLSHWQLEAKDAENRLQFAQEELHRLQSEHSQVQADIADLQQLQTHHQTQVDDLSEDQLQDQLGQAKDRQEAGEAAVIRLQIAIEDCDGQMDDIAEQLLRANQQNEDLIRQQTELSSQVQQLNNQLQALARQLTEDFQRSYDQAKQEATKLEDIGQARANLSQLRKDIKALGPVNSDAIAQYEEVNERLTFLNQQKADLDASKSLLLDTIQEMDSEVTERFQATFTAIQESFKQTFQQMFGGGSAKLLLTSSDLLEAGVDISVQPPGKKIQSLNLMSGGEKALSALALLFAIIRVKTIPFVILDEVEAALDEANVKRFGDYLNRFDKSSQFIVVTHRKGTMAAADSIYGVTMQESGVSKVLSVQLKELQN